MRVSRGPPASGLLALPFPLALLGIFRELVARRPGALLALRERALGPRQGFRPRRAPFLRVSVPALAALLGGDGRPHIELRPGVRRDLLPAADSPSLVNRPMSTP